MLELEASRSSSHIFLRQTSGATFFYFISTTIWGNLNKYGLVNTYKSLSADY